jgi:hypothetical protein
MMQYLRQNHLTIIELLLLALTFSGAVIIGLQQNAINSAQLRLEYQPAVEVTYGSNFTGQHELLVSNHGKAIIHYRKYRLTAWYDPRVERFGKTLPPPFDEQFTSPVSQPVPPNGSAVLAVPIEKAALKARDAEGVGTLILQLYFQNQTGECYQSTIRLQTRVQDGKLSSVNTFAESTSLSGC